MSPKANKGHDQMMALADGCCRHLAIQIQLELAELRMYICILIFDAKRANPEIARSMLCSHDSCRASTRPFLKSEPGCSPRYRLQWLSYMQIVSCRGETHIGSGELLHHLVESLGFLENGCGRGNAHPATPS
jgi:hypothetical protein